MPFVGGKGVKTSRAVSIMGCLVASTLSVSQSSAMIQPRYGMWQPKTHDTRFHWSRLTAEPMRTKKPSEKTVNKKISESRQEWDAERSEVEVLRYEMLHLRKLAATVAVATPPQIPERTLASRGTGLLNAASSQQASYVHSDSFLNRITTAALRLMGAGYRWGGASPATGFDCSGYIFYVFQQIGIHLPRTSFEQYQRGVAVAIGALNPGDLVFFTTYAKGPSHVGIYLGNGTFIHCLNANTGVVISRLDDSYYASRFVGARRVAISADPTPS
jgi:cell wall-associated NlpC family hydrolase